MGLALVPDEPPWRSFRIQLDAFATGQHPPLGKHDHQSIISYSSNTLLFYINCDQSNPQPIVRPLSFHLYLLSTADILKYFSMYNYSLLSDRPIRRWRNGVIAMLSRIVSQRRRMLHAPPSGVLLGRWETFFVWARPFYGDSMSIRHWRGDSDYFLGERGGVARRTMHVQNYTRHKIMGNRSVATRSPGGWPLVNTPESRTNSGLGAGAEEDCFIYLLECFWPGVQSPVDSVLPGREGWNGAGVLQKSDTTFNFIPPNPLCGIWKKKKLTFHFAFGDEAPPPKKKNPFSPSHLPAHLPSLHFECFLGRWEGGHHFSETEDAQ